MEDNINVFSIGTRVMLDGEIPATITSINLRGTERRVSYECTWWDGRTRKAEWFDTAEFTVAEGSNRGMFKLVFSDKEVSSRSAQRMVK